MTLGYWDVRGVSEGSVGAPGWDRARALGEAAEPGRFHVNGPAQGWPGQAQPAPSISVGRVRGRLWGGSVCVLGEGFT